MHSITTNLDNLISQQTDMIVCYGLASSHVLYKF